MRRFTKQIPDSNEVLINRISQQLTDELANQNLTDTPEQHIHPGLDSNDAFSFSTGSNQRMNLKIKT